MLKFYKHSVNWFNFQPSESESWYLLFGIICLADLLTARVAEGTAYSNGSTTEKRKQILKSRSLNLPTFYLSPRNTIVWTVWGGALTVKSKNRCKADQLGPTLWASSGLFQSFFPSLHWLFSCLGPLEEKNITPTSYLEWINSPCEYNTSSSCSISLGSRWACSASTRSLSASAAAFLSAGLL